MRAGGESRWNGENLENLCRKKRLMFLATRDLAYAKGRFALIGGVIALITLLVVMLTGLAAGLGKESVSAIDTLPSHGVDQIGFSAPAKGQKVGYDSSHVESKDIDQIKSVKGVTDASPLTITQGRASVSGVPSAVAVFAVPDGSFAAPKGVKNGSVVVGKTITKDAALKEGESISFNNKSVRVEKLSDDASYQHQPVVWMTESDAKAAGLLGQGSGTVALVKTGSGFSKDALTSATGLDVQDPKTSLGTISAYQAENGSLTLMRVMLMLVSALVVGAFFTVWTIQRTPDLAVLKAMGAHTGYLVRDAMGQAAILLLVGGGLGTIVATVLGYFAQGTVPFVLSLTTTLVPLALLFVLGLLGALVSVRRIVTVDPNTALGAAR